MVLKNGTIRSALGGRSFEKPLCTQRMNSSSTLMFDVSLTLNARYRAATSPITDCQKYFSPDGMPSGFLWTTLRQSSTQPIAPKPIVTSITIQTKRLLQSNHSSVETPMPIRINTPPIVGVPLLTM